jgi:hypothetical protein
MRRRRMGSGCAGHHLAMSEHEDASPKVRRTGGALVLALVSVVLTAACGGQGTLGAKALGEQSKAVQSLAAEGALLAQDAAAGKSTRIYRREHSNELSAAASKAEASLESARTKPALEAKRRALTALAGKVRVDLERLASASEDEQRTLGKALGAAAQQSERIAEQLA